MLVRKFWLFLILQIIGNQRSLIGVIVSLVLSLLFSFDFGFGLVTGLYTIIPILFFKQLLQIGRFLMTNGIKRAFGISYFAQIANICVLSLTQNGLETEVIVFLAYVALILIYRNFEILYFLWYLIRVWWIFQCLSALWRPRKREVLRLHLELFWA